MFSQIISTIAKIPALLESIIGAIIYFIISQAGGNLTSEFAKATVCQMSGFDSWFLCLFFTHPLVAFLSTIGTVIAIGLSIRAKMAKK